MRSPFHDHHRPPGSPTPPPPSMPFWSTPRSARPADSSPMCPRRSGPISLARTPDVTARRLRELGAEAGRILTGTSTMAPSRDRDRRFTDVAWTENPLLKRLVQLYLAGSHTAEQLLARRRPRPSRPRTRAVLPRERHPGDLSEQRPAGQPDLGQGGGRHRRVEPRARGQAAGIGPGFGTAPSGDGRRQRLHPGRDDRRDAWRGGVPQPGAGTDPVRTADRRGLRGAGAGGPTHDQQVLRTRPRPRQEPGGVRRPARPADVPHLLAQPGHAARILGPRHLRARRPGRPRRRRGDHRQHSDGARWGVLRRHPREHRRAHTSPLSASRTGWPGSSSR